LKAYTSNFGISQRKKPVSVKKTDILMFYRETMGIDSENYKRDIMYEEVQTYNMSNVVVHIIITKQ